MFWSWIFHLVFFPYLYIINKNIKNKLPSVPINDHYVSLFGLCLYVNNDIISENPALPRTAFHMACTRVCRRRPGPRVFVSAHGVGKPHIPPFDWHQGFFLSGDIYEIKPYRGERISSAVVVSLWYHYDNLQSSASVKSRLLRSKWIEFRGKTILTLSADDSSRVYCFDWHVRRIDLHLFKSRALEVGSIFNITRVPVRWEGGGLLYTLQWVFRWRGIMDFDA